MVRLLLSYCAKVNIADNTGATPLFAASISGHAEIIRLLLERGAPVNAKNEEGSTPLIGACGTESIESLPE
jgi:uncharacterized protein